jgi:cytochrome c biogenesis factor
MVALIAVLYGIYMNAKRSDNYSRYRGIAAHVIHLGILLILIGIVASSNLKAESSLILTAGNEGDFPDQHYSMTVTDMNSDFRGSPYKHYKGSEYVTLISFDVFKNGKYFDSGEVEYITDLKWGQSYTTTYINRGIVEEVFIVPKAVDETTDRVNMYVRTVPLITFLWTGLLAMAGGMLVLGILEYSKDSRVLNLKEKDKQIQIEATK